MENVTHVQSPWGNYSIGVNLPHEVQQLLREKAAEYEVTPQEIADEACAKTRDVSAEVIWEYVKQL